jgi:hypothetical protein
MDRHRPHALAPSPSTARLAIIYKNFAAHKGVSHIGLGVAAMNTQRTLQRLGYWTEVWPCVSAQEIRAQLEATQVAAHRDGQHPVSHVVISAPWVPTDQMAALLRDFPQVHFTVVSHSNVGFLMADPNGIRLLREGLSLSLGHHNFGVAGNCEKFVEAWSTMYGRGMTWLPNLYDYTTAQQVGQRQPWHAGQTLRVGIFGATRPLKNIPSAVAAAIALSAQLRADVEIWCSAGRSEGGGDTVDRAVQQEVANLPHVKLCHAGWRAWPDFRSVVGKMHVLMQPSYTESFNMVTADGVCEGVASVVSDAIEWVPSDWQARADDVLDITRVARHLLTDPHAVDRGQAALRSYVDRGALRWRAFLGGER